MALADPGPSAVELEAAERWRSAPMTSAVSGHMRYGSLDIDAAARRVTVHGRPIELTVKEFDLLAYLASWPGRVFSREELLRAVWQSTSAWQRSTTVTEHIRRLRSKLGDDMATPLLVAVRSIGYRFDAPAPNAPAPNAPDHPALPAPGSELFHVEGRIVEADADIRAILGIASGEDLVGGRVIDGAGREVYEANQRALRQP